LQLGHAILGRFLRVLQFDQQVAYLPAQPVLLYLCRLVSLEYV
jgi:hypothetical protein